MEKLNRLVLVGNGFDLAHGLKTSYKHFIDWYMCGAFEQFCEKRHYADQLMALKNKYSGLSTEFKERPTDFRRVIKLMSANENQVLVFPSQFMHRLVNTFQSNNWVDIERDYFNLLKSYFLNPHQESKKKIVTQLNSEFDFLITKLVEYIEVVNDSIQQIPSLPIERSHCNLAKVFDVADSSSDLKILNFNYTETLLSKNFADEHEVIFIHGRVKRLKENPIIFGYGDESDPAYQEMEDSGENAYLEHMKSFGYFRTDNYQKLLSYIDSAPYMVYTVGHSCGLSDRILLREIFEHPNCKSIEVFYYKRPDGSDNFKEITQEISRHFSPNNKNLMRRKVKGFNAGNYMPQSCA